MKADDSCADALNKPVLCPLPNLSIYLTVLSSAPVPNYAERLQIREITSTVSLCINIPPQMSRFSDHNKNMVCKLFFFLSEAHKALPTRSDAESYTGPLVSYGSIHLLIN